MGTHCTTFKEDLTCDQCKDMVKNARAAIKYAKEQGRPNSIDVAQCKGMLAFVKLSCTNRTVHGWKATCHGCRHEGACKQNPSSCGYWD
jgi:crotonobetainyl-CoA:carnitine CoA-transferase CaiB-like acyl-CoA transferase